MYTANDARDARPSSDVSVSIGARVPRLSDRASAYLSAVDAWVLAVVRARAPEDVAFAIASDEYPGLDSTRYRRWLDGHGAEVAARTAKLGSLERARLMNFARETVSDPLHARACLEPVGLRTVAVRLLLNLQRIHGQRGDHARALVVSDRLYELTRALAHRVDRGVHALALGTTQAAIDDFEAYLNAHPQGEIAERARAELQRARRAPPPSVN